MSDLILFRNTLRDMLRPRKLFWVVLLILIPSGIALLFRLHPSRDGFHAQEVYDSLSLLMVFGFILVILSVIFGTGVLMQEIEQKTIVYLLTRPVPRWRILLVKFAATVTMTTATAWLASLLMALITVGPGGLMGAHFLRDLLVLLVGAMAYGGLFLLLATLINRGLIPMIFGLLYGFVWETLMPLMPGNFKMLSLMSYLHVLAPHADVSDQADMSNSILAAPNQSSITHTLAWLVLLGVILGALALAMAVFSTKEYVPREDAS